MYERKNFIDDLPHVDFVIFTEGNFEYLSIATSKQFFFLYDLLRFPHNLIGLHVLATIAAEEVLKCYSVLYILHFYRILYFPCILWLS